jgi:hypothetical protein
MTLIVKPEQIDFISKHIDENIYVHGPRCCGLTYMAITEAAYSMKIGFDTSVCTYSLWNAQSFTNILKDSHREINTYVYRTSNNAVVDIFAFTNTDSQLGKPLKEKIIFDDCYEEFTKRGYNWRNFAKTISIYSHDLSIDVPNNCKEFKISVEQPKQKVNPCPNCSFEMVKKQTEGLLYSGGIIDVLKCNNCGYCA